jgi:hypothetical protein
MGRAISRSLVILGTLALSVAAHGAQRTITGTVTGMEVPTPKFGTPAETILFQLSNPPPATGCTLPTNGWFAFSPTTVTDAQTRKNLLATLLTAKATGVNVLVVYDDAGANCDPFGYPAPTVILVQ